LQKGYLSELGTSPSLATPTARGSSSVTSAEPAKFNYKEERKRLDTLIKKTQKEITDHEKRLLDLAKTQAEMTEKLITMTGPQAQTLSKELHGISATIMETEEKVLSLMESLDLAQKDLESLVQQG
jgi:ATP-binding cassette subfamily F protein 3